MKMAVVGNGPTAVGKGAEIDALDFVVRLTTFPAVFPNHEAGERLDAWAWYGNPGIVALPGPPADKPAVLAAAPAGSYEVWQTLPPSRCAGGHVGNLGNTVEHLGARVLRCVSELEFGHQAAWVTLHSERLAWVAPTSGFCAVDFALRRFHPEELHLFGFDATAPDKAGWGDATPTGLAWTPDGNGHDHLAEKRALALLRDSGLWLGRTHDTRLVWHDAPEVWP